MGSSLKDRVKRLEGQCAMVSNRLIIIDSAEVVDVDEAIEKARQQCPGESRILLIMDEIEKEVN
jgi:hypothetical protein